MEGGRRQQVKPRAGEEAGCSGTRAEYLRLLVEIAHRRKDGNYPCNYIKKQKSESPQQRLLSSTHAVRTQDLVTVQPGRVGQAGRVSGEARVSLLCQLVS